MAENLYTILQLPRTASEADIKKQFRKLAVKYHPDKNPGDAAAELMMKKINAAYAVLSDNVARKKYDQELDNEHRQNNHHNYPPPQSGKNYYDTYHFETFAEFISRISSFFYDYTSPFGDAFNVQLQNYQVNITITPEQAQKGCIIPFEFVKTERCKQCQGRHFATGTCTKCINGAVTLRAKNSNIILPAGVTHNSVWKSPNELIAAPTGQYFDLYIRVRVADPNAKSEYDIEMRVTIPLETAFKGKDIKITTTRGPIKLTVPELTFTGKQVRVPNRGNIDPHSGATGDLYLTFTVDIPDNPTIIQQIQIEKIIENQRKYEKYNN